MSRTDPGRVPSIPACLSSASSEDSATGSRHHTPWGSWSNHGESKREVMDTPSSKIDEESREKMQRMQTLSSRGLCKSANSTSAMRKNGR